MERTLTRRTMVKLVVGAGAGAGAGAAAVAGGLTLPRTSSAQTLDGSGWYLTTSDLNLRSRPSRKAAVLTVMPANAAVEGLGEVKNGFVKVAYQGRGGWAHGDYLTPTNGGSDDPPTVIGRSRTTSDVNFRRGPSTGHEVLRVLPESTWVDVTDRVDSGFRFVYYADRGGWISQTYLDWDETGGRGYLTVTSDLNLRAEPSRNAVVLRVMEQGSRVHARDEVVNGFRRVTYIGVGAATDGWAYDDYLA